MARWKLAAPHYLFTTSNEEWEYTENSRSTGKPIRQKFRVPRLLDPKDPGDWTKSWGNRDNQDGEIIVCLPGKGEDTDVAFIGDPTPDMIPVDDEARAISATFEKHWSFKPDTEEPGRFSQSLVDKFQDKMSEMQSKPAEVPGLTDLVAVIAKQTEALTKLASDRRV